jgi:stage III sporulation protein SpoIIIAA
VEVILDVGRVPVARFPSGDIKLAADKVTYDDIDAAVSKVSDSCLDLLASSLP